MFTWAFNGGGIGHLITEWDEEFYDKACRNRIST